VGKTAVSALCP